MRSAIIAGMLALLATACGVVSPNNATQRDQTTVNQQQKIYQINQPVPVFDWSQERDTLTQIYVMRNEARQTYTIVSSQGTGKTLFECPSRGTAIPADTQLTNPLRIDMARPDGATSWIPGVIGQPEPNGLYSSVNTDGTWVLCIRKDGSLAPVYTEQKVTTFPFAVKWDDEKQQYIDADGASSMSVRLGQKPANIIIPPTPTPEGKR